MKARQYNAFRRLWSGGDIILYERKNWYKLNSFSCNYTK